MGGFKMPLTPGDFEFITIFGKPMVVFLLLLLDEANAVVYTAADFGREGTILDC